MNMKHAVDLILTGKRAASRSGSNFVIDRFRLGMIGGFSASEMDRIEKAVADIERSISEVMETLQS